MKRDITSVFISTTGHGLISPSECNTNIRKTLLLGADKVRHSLNSAIGQFGYSWVQRQSKFSAKQNNER